MMFQIDPQSLVTMLSRQIVATAPPLKERRSRLAPDKPVRHGPLRPRRLPRRIMEALRKLRAIGGFAMLTEVLASTLGYSNHVRLALAIMTAGVAALFVKVLHTP